MATEKVFRARINKRRIRELFIDGEYISIQLLKNRDDIKLEQKIQKYLAKDISDYPSPVEFHITEVAHVTNKTSLEDIWELEGFMGLDRYSLSWWSLKINEADIKAAEERYLEELFPDITKEEKTAHPPFLSKFTTSPVFINETSRYGNFRFTFSLTELMEAYKKQICNDKEPVLRIYETKLFKQEIEYVVLIHSPEFNDQLSHFPLLTSNPWVAYDGNKIIWKAQAICETHNFQLVTGQNTAEVQTKYLYQFYVWDQVSLAFHTSEVLTFPKRKLKASLSCCEQDPNVNLSNGQNCSSLDEAKKCIESLQDDDEKEDEKEDINP
ncbi:hypothetical protein QQF64_000333 [Cirrhinus molitorella]|uniref:Uncharacterized protein n=1 Tax=Cirrhinus molitorella TaxID=172907 RepID=A0ABR3NYG1_9TELE